MTPQEILALPMDPEKNDAGASSVREYLRSLVLTLWREGEGFSGKRPFGNSSWEYELYAPLLQAGLIVLGEDDSCDDENNPSAGFYLAHKTKAIADELIEGAISVL